MQISLAATDGAGGCKPAFVLAEQHWSYLRARAVDDRIAAERGYQSAISKSQLQSLEFSPAQQNLIPALIIPIWGVHAKIESHQLRPDQPRLNKQGKARKFEAKAGMHMLVDAHPRLTRPRDGGVSPIADQKIPLIITEGIPKADSAISIGLCCIALLGVWNFRGSNEAGGKVALACWECVALNDRVVYIAFDSDVMEKSGVYSALVRLKAFLESRGAAIKLIYLPSGEGGRKVGLDDYIVAQQAAGRSAQQVREGLLALATTELRTPIENQVGGYRETKHGLVRISISPEGDETTEGLTNFTARIEGDIITDDGAETLRSFEIKVYQGQRTARANVSVAQFSLMRWPVEALGSGAVVYAGRGTADHARAAIQLLSQSPARRTVYAHTGWRRVNDIWVYLHGAGGIGAAGAVDGIEVSLPPELAPLRLEVSQDTTAAIRASLEVLDVAPDRVTVAAYGTIWRAVLGSADFSVFLYGRTGLFKTEIASLIQSHFGAAFDSRHLPTSFTSTANTNELLAFTAKDAVLVIDELHPPASGSERELMFRDAGRLLRSQGNAAGRGRMRADGTLRPAKPPRGLMLATGEELPRGQSTHARLFTNEMRAGDVSVERLTQCQQHAAAGLYAQATTAFVQWLASRLEKTRAEFERLRAEARNQIQYQHARTADIRAQLGASYEILLRFLLDSGTISESEAAQLKARVGVALEEVANAQKQYADSVEPVAAFARLLNSAIVAGRAHVADPSGGAPGAREQACGWRKERIGTGQYEREEWRPQGERVGWVDGDCLYLDRDAAYRAAQLMAVGGVGIEVSATTLVRRLRDRGLLVKVDQRREVLTARETFEGRRRDVVCLCENYLSLDFQVDRVHATWQES